MKNWFAAIVIVLLGAVVGGIAWQAVKRPTSPRVPAASSGHSESLGVDQFMRNADRHPGVVRLKGVVSAVDVKQSAFALIDLEEFQKCQITSCARLVLPVRGPKNMPGIGETVVVTGSVQKSGQNRIFAATDVERVATESRSR